jgi:hypothetical protein
LPEHSIYSLFPLSFAWLKNEENKYSRKFLSRIGIGCFVQNQRVRRRRCIHEIRKTPCIVYGHFGGSAPSSCSSVARSPSQDINDKNRETVGSQGPASKVFVLLSSCRSGPLSRVTASCRFFRILVPKIATFSDHTQRLPVSGRLILAVAAAASDGVGACRDVGLRLKTAQIYDVRPVPKST